MGIGPSTTSSGTSISRDGALTFLVEGAQSGRPIVPLVGAGISIEAGVPPLSELARYLAKTKAYLRYRVYKNLSPAAETADAPRLDPYSRSLPSLGFQPRDFLREFGWPDPNELTSVLWHWLWHRAPVGKEFYRSMDRLIDREILDSLAVIDQHLASNVGRLARRSRKNPERWRLLGSYWKILLTQLTRASPDLVDTLFRRLTRSREPVTAHRYFAFLTPVLRLRLFLTINFDTLLEDALRAEGLRPTVYEVAEGLSLPNPKLVQDGLSVIKLHGGAYGLLVGDKLDSPLDAETRDRFRAYLPEHLVLLVMGVGGWDQRVLDMVELALKRGGDVLWLHFEPTRPGPLSERFDKDKARLWTALVQDPGAFLREVYSQYKDSHPSSSRPFQPCDLRPVPVRVSGAEAPAGSARVVVFKDHQADFGLGASLRLAEFVASKAATHLPVWVDLETKFTVEDVLVELIQSLRRYDPGLPPEILVMERSTSPAGTNVQATDFRKVVRRLYAALSRGRYIVAFNGVQSFGRPPTRHHSYEDGKFHPHLEAETRKFAAFLHRLIGEIDPPPDSSVLLGESLPPDQPQNLGLLDSIFAFALDYPHPNISPAARVLVKLCGKEIYKTTKIFLGEERFDALKKGRWQQDPTLVLLTAFRRRRSIAALHQLMPKYMVLRDQTEHPGENTGGHSPDRAAVDAEIRGLEEKGYLWRLEGGDYWMSRKLRNSIYDQVLAATRSAVPEAVRARAALAFVHLDLADYHHRELYVASQDVTSLLEELYHRISSLRYLRQLQDTVSSVDLKDEDITQWVLALAGPTTEAVGGGQVDLNLLARLRYRGARALREILAQEREVLLCRVPSVTFQDWVQDVREDLEQISPERDSAPKPWRDSLQQERQALAELLEDIEAEILSDRLKTGELFILRSRGLREQVARFQGRSVEKNPGRKPKLEQLEELCRSNRVPDPQLWLVRQRVILALMDIVRAVGRSTRASKLAHRDVDHYNVWIAKLLESWSPKDKQRRGVVASTNGPESTEILQLKVKHLRVLADQVLWKVNPWETKDRDYAALEGQRAAARETLGLSDKALWILESIREDDRAQRSYFYSLKGRARYLSFDFDSAYREFDFARAGLSESTPGDREALAVSLLRQAECLMAHADDALVLWVLRLVESDVFEPGDKPWWRLMSSAALKKRQEGAQEIQAGRDSDEALLRLSLGNFDRKVLAALESRARMVKAHGRKLADTLDVMRSRLAAAGELLDRVEGLLEYSRRKVEWWACLFQLRSQLATERLLLLLAVGRLSSGGTSLEDLSQMEAVHWAAEIEEERVRSTGNLSKEDNYRWEEVRRWLLDHDASNPLPPPSGGAPVDNPFREKRRRARFNNRFQSLLRDGVMAVRQGLDVLLPGDAERRKGGLQHAVLLNRLLRSWAALMVCGAHVTVMSRRAREKPGSAEESKLLWEQWRYLNWLSGLVILPGCARLQRWFHSEVWSSDCPGLVSRARTLAQFNSEAVEWLQDELRLEAIARSRQAKGASRPRATS